MQTWWGSLDPFMQTLWGIAIAASAVFIIQSIMTFVGMDSETNFDGDFDGDMSADDAGESTPFQLFTFRNLINFMLGFSWTAIALRASTESTSLMLVGGVVVGVLLVCAVMYLFKWMSGMQQSGTIEPEALVGCKGSVYLTIPAGRTGEGKVQITVRSAIREYNAMTDGDRLPNEAPIRVVAVLNGHTVLVEKV
ncbi:serine protease [Tannerella sp. oral taxon BU063 isolate Cell 6/7/9]|uniref:Serine protease n=1 Tax=Tannerella sp. oral taxon BU063 isolate Cell 6/7/9 TaxID=1411021 RepID=W2CJA9_9BACT|nr:serine protease [Tannerella sp. oral taxon BU063 isolate Cell 6/7/9]